MEEPLLPTTNIKEEKVKNVTNADRVAQISLCNSEYWCRVRESFRVLKAVIIFDFFIMNMIGLIMSIVPITIISVPEDHGAVAGQDLFFSIVVCMILLKSTFFVLSILHKEDPSDSLLFVFVALPWAIQFVATCFLFLIWFCHGLLKPAIDVLSMLSIIFADGLLATKDYITPYKVRQFLGFHTP